MQLCGVSLSPFYEKIIIGLEIKGALAAIEMPGIPGGFKSEQHFAANPVGKIPYLLLDDGSSMVESDIVFDYLNTILDGPSLLPADPLEAAKVKMIGRLFDNEVMSNMWPFLRAINFNIQDDAAIEKARAEGLPKALDCVERFMGDGPFAWESEWTMADCVLLPFLYMAKNYLPQFGIDDAIGSRPKLLAWRNHISSTDIYANSMERIDTSRKAIMAMMKAQNNA